MNPPRYRFMKPRSPLLSGSWIHVAPFDSTGSVKPALGFLEVKLRSRPQPVNTMPLGSTVGSTITQHFTTATPHK
ncbi:hypothetical protein E2C01_075554 [Portunus trituberculatus]|uniref:Uncharacterized protein n=1 Tax=Portunus trituberculatus TaxID=210409 RepID=A0A5B7IG44_PORTR|nr:hypothetical protein [Portunus trituberculatus]